MEQTPLTWSHKCNVSSILVSESVFLRGIVLVIIVGHWIVYGMTKKYSEMFKIN